MEGPGRGNRWEGQGHILGFLYGKQNSTGTWPDFTVQYIISLEFRPKASIETGLCPKMGQYKFVITQFDIFVGFMLKSTNLYLLLFQKDPYRVYQYIPQTMMMIPQMKLERLLTNF